MLKRLKKGILGIRIEGIVAEKRDMGLLSMEETLGEDGISPMQSGKSSDPKLESARERSDTLKVEPGNSKCKGFDPIDENGIKAQDREESKSRYRKE
ncbi:Hypothetical predicted protein [Olea europaea subsp. europaea]|uniref:Uncharacterized protein n=1 Tax=Olea europaea subsp. europaea TaxID=158383 RepID=A0A8S0Q8M6_OLEEU|nr:Hypothetical predicted protein [Olea europaea subsp. europaea]